MTDRKPLSAVHDSKPPAVPEVADSNFYFQEIPTMKKHLIRLSAAALGLAVAAMAALAVRHTPAGLTLPVYRVSAREKVVALTFDDGPSSAFTPRILRVLAR